MGRYLLMRVAEGDENRHAAAENEGDRLNGLEGCAALVAMV